MVESADIQSSSRRGRPVAEEVRRVLVQTKRSASIASDGFQEAVAAGRVVAVHLTCRSGTRVHTLRRLHWPVGAFAEWRNARLIG